MKWNAFMQSVYKKFVSLAVFLALFVSFCINGCTQARSTEPISQSGFYFDTLIQVTLYDAAKSAELAHCFEMADEYEKMFSTKIADSDVSRINAAGGQPVTVSDDTIALLEKGLYYAKLSDGRFDITVGRLTSLWDFQADSPIVPDAEAIEKAIATIDYQNVVIDGVTVALKNPDAAIDLGGIAKGYIADKMKEYLVSQGIKSGLINLGGNVLTIGTKTDGSDYQIGIQKPFSKDGEAIAAVQIHNQTVVTSGTYERYFTNQDILYHHILDVTTGYPYQNELSSVSIICQYSADGDGLSTTCFALGLEAGMELIESLPDTEAVFITTDNELHYSSGMGTTIPIKKL